VILEPADYVPAFGGIEVTNPRDLAFARILAQNLPRWPSAQADIPTNARDLELALKLGQNLPRWPSKGEDVPPTQPAPWLWQPSLAFPTQGPVLVLTTPGAPGTTPVPQAFFPPVGRDVAPGVPRLVPLAIGGQTAQQDVFRLQPSTHPELYGQVDQAYWRRPFALSAADSATTAAMGQELGQWLKPGGFLELRLIRGEQDELQARAIAAQIPDSRIVVVPRGAIAAYARSGQRPPKLTDEQWTVLEHAGPDIRGEFGALGEGTFARIVRIYRGGTAPP
jgi:hypothetical protein